MTEDTGARRVPAGVDALGEWFPQAWRLFASAWLVWVLQALIALAVLLVVAALVAGLALAVGIVFSLQGRHPQVPPGAMCTFVLVGLVAFLLLVVVQAWLMAGMVHTAEKQWRGEVIEVRDLFGAGWAVLPATGASLIAGLLVLIGLALCVIPGLIAGLFFALAVPLVVIRRLGTIAALLESVALVRQNFVLFLLYLLLNGLLTGMLTQTGIGFFVGYPLQALLLAVPVLWLYRGMAAGGGEVQAT